MRNKTITAESCNGYEIEQFLDFELLVFFLCSSLPLLWPLKVKITHKVFFNLEILSDLQTGDVKGTESSSSGRDVKWTCGRELVLHSSKSVGWSPCEGVKDYPMMNSGSNTN